MSKKALITGITGQDGSYLAEQLLAKGYEVHGIIRRSSSFNTERLDDLYRDPHEQQVKLLLHHGDLTESSRLVRLVYEIQPDEVYHLGAQSHVRVSFDVPEYTSDVTGMGTVRLLEAIRDAGVEPRFYQASSSEMYGSTPPPQHEGTPFHPRSPYAVAKLAAFWITVNYRESYGMFATNGILFNHECVSASTPLVVRRRGVVAVATAPDLVPLRRTGANVQAFEPPDLLEIWDGERWTPVRAVTATKRRRDDPDHRLLCVQARGGVVDVTAHHHMLDADREQVSAGDVGEGDALALATEMPETPHWTAVTAEMAELLGLLAADGFVSVDGHHVRFTNNDPALRHRVTQLWSQTFLGDVTAWTGVSGFDPDQGVEALNLHGAATAGPWLREQLYTRTRLKQVPPVVLNADGAAHDAFIAGYHAGDGLKRGNGASFTTTSAVLAQGLCWLYSVRGQDASVYVEQRAGRTYYRCNLPSMAAVGGEGAHLRRPPAEVRRIDPSMVTDDEWVFDLETESGVFCAGVGRLVVHNSPRRGETFVTRKITRALARIHAGLQDKLYLGNLDAQRDWGYAADYTDAMWRILQADEPEDFVIATGEMHSVREFLDVAGARLGLNWQDVVEIDPRYYRPAEVDALCGDASKAREKLDWTPTVTFQGLVEMMIDADRTSLEDQLAGRAVRLS